MTKGSDIIKIGFDYRASLEQFEKETNGVFDGISAKAGKQRISIQLDAKNDKVIEKIKELQKLKLDKFTFEFGESGLAEQLKTFDQLEKKINEIINLSKGFNNNQSSIIDAKDSTNQIDKIQNKLNELTKKYDELSNKKLNSGISGKDINLVDNDEFKKLSDEFTLLKDELSGLKREMQLFEEATVSADIFVKMETNVNGLIVKVDDLIDKYVQLSVTQKNITSDKSNISSENTDVVSGNSSQQESKEIQKAWEDNLKAITDYMDAKTKLNNLEASDKKSNKKSNEIADLTQEVEKAKVKAEEARIALSSMVNPNDVDIDTWDKWLKMMEDFRQAGDGSSKSIAKLKDAIANVNTSELQTIDKYIESTQKKLDSTKSSRDDSEKSSSFKTYEKEVQECIAALIAERNRLENAVKSGDIEIIDEESLSNLNKLKQKLKETNSGFKTMFKGSAEVSRWKEIDTITKYMEKNTRISKEAKDKLREYIETLKTNGADANVEEIHKAFLRVCDGERKAKREGQSFLDVLRDKVWYQWAAQIGSYFSLNDIFRYAKEGIQTVRELDTALVEMRKVSDESVQSLKNYQATTFDVANEIGTTAIQIQNSTSDWLRLGYSIQEASELAKNSNIYKNVGDMEIQEATEHMISSVQAWKSEFNDNVIDTSKAVIDRYNKIGNEFAISSADIGQAMETSAAALKAGGNSLNESLGILTAANIIQQDASTTSSALKILSLRIRGAKADLEEMGESTDGLADSSSKMREELLGLTGVDIMLDENTFKSTAQIIQEIGENWSKMTDASQAAALELMAGKNRASTVAGLIENYETIAEVIEAAENAEGSALEENEKYLDSIDGKIQQFTNTVQKFWASFKADGLIKGVVDAGTTLLDLITKITDKVGLIGSAGIVGGGILGLKNIGKYIRAYGFQIVNTCFEYALYA